MFGKTNMDIAREALAFTALAEAEARERRNKFQVEVKDKNFTTEDLSVKTIDGFIVVEGKYEDRKDKHGYVSRHNTHRCTLPEGFIPNPESVKFKLSSKGVLTVTAQRMVPVAAQGERNIPVTPVRKEEKDQAESDK